MGVYAQGRACVRACVREWKKDACMYLFELTFCSLFMSLIKGPFIHVDGRMFVVYI